MAALVMSKLLHSSALGLLLAFVPITHAHAADTKLQANAVLSFDFPNLPDTLMTLSSGEKKPARLTAQLPENYSRDGKFPLFIFLTGGAGGRGDAQPSARELVGTRHFICVNLPQFKRSYSTNEAFRGVVISTEDFATVSGAYRTMLEKLLDTVPNITPQGSTLGGFSNGANTTAVLLAGQDEFILRHFDSFFLIEGGFGPLNANILQKPAIKRCRFLILRGDAPEDEHPGVRESNEYQARALESAAREFHLDFTSVVMRGAGHALPPNYEILLGQWSQGEKLSAQETK
jgi:predicted esterase